MTRPYKKRFQSRAGIRDARWGGNSGGQLGRHRVDELAVREPSAALLALEKNWRSSMKI